MTRGKFAFTGLLGLLLLMTGVFTASSASSLGERTIAAITDELVLVNGDAIHEEEFTARVATVEQNVLMLRAQVEMSDERDPIAEEFLDLMDSTAAETIALASLILDVAIYQEAVGRGFQPDSALIEEHVRQERATFEMIEEDPAQFGVAQEDVDAYREHIDEVGEGRYWSEYYPQLIEQRFAVDQLRNAVAGHGQDWLTVQQEIFHEADVAVLDDEAIAPATVPDARRYLDAIWVLTAQP
jgi:hypothetical protein